jgi:RNA polymerase sigma factor (sigma-70 family)
VSESNNKFEKELEEIQLNLYNFINSKIYSEHDAQDILQKTNLILCSKKNQYREGLLNKWATSVADYQMKAFFTEVKRNKVFCCEQIPESTMYESNNSKEYSLKYKILLSCIESLPEHQKYIAYLRYTKSLPLKDICKFSGRSIGAVSATIYRANQSLKEIVLKEYEKCQQI